PMNYGPTHFRDFDDFCAHLKSRKRYAIKRSRQKFAASSLRAIQVRGSDGFDRLYSEEVHALFLEVAQTKKRLHDIPAAFFRELAHQLPQETILTLICDGAQVLAFAISLCTANWYQQLFVGFNHERNAEFDLYFNLFFEAIDYAWRQNVDQLLLGQSSDTFKHQKLAAFQHPRYFYIRPFGALRGILAPYVIKARWPIAEKEAPVDPRERSNVYARPSRCTEPGSCANSIADIPNASGLDDHPGRTPISRT
ncbi:MAG: GNAT family N-acetyltransferase, partial [Chromatiaceae bacterium]|nr:GNAT family N-acetyltransferase [Chromatiaceae bacterium]